ncbi:S-layer homology domain-containing protein [Flavonifractor plautii]|uniref:S-layer homology domain-containing protein n=1 Tax=Flavonifractor plautii TaxID=292800 RepID=UPI00210C3CAE|nr:S-layer homology domain-containing protein [Flavonifractor plautii]MCQ4784848.1 S-layer homology domain-containing protein [Flavonifractor plautii]
MKRTHRGLARLLSAGMSLALLTSLVPGATAASSTLNYKVDSDDILEIKDSDFSRFDMDYILFTELPGSREGELYYVDEDDREQSIGRNDKIYWDDFYGLVFEPDENYDGTVSLDFEGEDSYGDDYYGTLEIEVYGIRNSSSDGEVTYEVDVNDAVDLDVDDFDDYAYDESDGTEVDYIFFTDLPSSSKGTLYYDYGYSSEREVEEDEEFDRDEIEYLTFVPKRNYEGTVTLSFEGRSDARDKFYGDLVIEVGGGQSSSAARGDVTYDVDVNDTVDFDYDDFDEFVYDETSGTEVGRVWFTELPSSREGTLYRDYDKRDQEEIDEDEEIRHDEIDNLTFVPKRNFEGAVTIPFEGRADDGDKFSGELVIRVGDAGGADITVELQAGNGSTVNFQTDAFNEACVKETGANLNYVIFEYDSGRGGYLYYQHGESGESEVGSGRYYRASSPRLDQVSFVPGSGTGSSVRIPFEGEATNGKSFYGEVKLTYVTLSEPTIITYTSTGLAVDFNAADFTAACAARGGKALTSVRFPAPDTTGGQLYYNFHTPTQYRGEVVSSVDYSVGGVYLLGEVTFLPKAGYSGIVTIPYVGKDADGIEYTGTVQVMVTPSASSRFSDMDSYNSWAGASVEFLAAYGITTGTGDGATFSPASTLTRGDYILMLYRTFGFSSTTAAGNFTDVAAGSYYAEALAHAKALGIATAEADGSFRPNDPVTRQDAMVFLLRAMQAVNRSVPNAYDSYLSRFPDGASVADYARTAMAAMAQAGVIQGNEQGKLNPTGTLNRAEMAVILHRALTL